MKRERSPSDPPDYSVRERLLAGATELFARKGYAATNVREIVQAAGVTKPALYYYFKNKEGIYLELMKEAAGKLDRLFDAYPREPGSIQARILKLYDRVFGIFMEHIQLARIMYSIYYGPPQGAPFFDFEAYHLKMRDTIRKLVREGIRKGEFIKGNIENMVWAILGVLNVATEVQLAHPEMEFKGQRLSGVLKVIFQGIAAERNQKKGEKP